MSDTNTQKKIIPGKNFNLSGEDYEVPPLSARGVKDLQTDILDLYLKLRPMVAELDSIKKKIDKIGTENATDELMELMDKYVTLSQEVANVEFEVSCRTAYAAFKRNYPDVVYDDFLDLPSKFQIKEISDWAVNGDISAKKS